MPGPAPKPKEERRTRHVPRAGEWVELPPEGQAAPPLPAGNWSEFTREAWETWWSDPVSTQWGAADRKLAELCLGLYEQWMTSDVVTVYTQLLRTLDNLGLTPKGKQDRRWKVAEDPIERTKARRSPRERAHLTAVK